MLIRRRMMVESGSDAPLYPFVNGTHQFSTTGTGNRKVVVTNGNHFELTRTSGNKDNLINVSNIAQNGTDSSQSSNINNLPKIFTIPSGATVVLTLDNIIATLQTGYNQNWAFGVRGTGTTTISGLTTGNYIGTPTPPTITVTTQVASATDVGCLFFYSQAQYNKIAADVYLYVNGIRYI